MKKTLPVISGKTINNGVVYYTQDKPENHEIFKDSLTISTRGEYSGTVTYHKGEFVLANNILVMEMPNYTERQKMFIGSIINKLPYGGYNGYPTRDKLKEDIIKLPINKRGKIDLEFMEKFIKQLEAERVEQLEAYLKTTGLKDYKLTDKEKNILDKFNQIIWKKYNLQNLFGKATRGKRLKSADRIKGDLPFVTAGEADTGISDYINNDVEIFSPNTITIDMFGSAKYRGYEYGADDHIAVVHSENRTRRQSMFITTSINKVSHNGQFTHSYNFYAKHADDLDIMLPIDENNELDFEYMETFITAIQKLVIKDVVEYADKKINATKQVINN